MKQKAISSALIASGLLFGGVSPSYADFKTYPGSECVRWNENVDPASYLFFSQRFNPSTSRVLFLDCLADHDRAKGGVGVASSWIRVIDQNPTDRICAQLVGFSHIGASVFIRLTPFQCTSVAGASPDSVELNTGGLSGVPFDAHYYFSVQAVPRRSGDRDSGVVTYFVNEFSVAD